MTRDVRTLRNHKRLLLTFLAFFLFTSPSIAQYKLSLEGGYLAGFNFQEVELHHDEVHTKLSNGYAFSLVQGVRIKQKHWEPTLKLGVKYIHTRGELDELSFKAETYKAAIALGTQYHIDTNFTVGLMVGMENNLDFEFFRSQTPDLFRFTLQGEFQYHISKRWDALFIYESALSPLKDQYLLTNPRHQFRFGIIFNIL